MRELMVNRLDVELYVQVHGDENKPTILFLHGFPDCHRTWENQVRVLKKDYQVVTFDMRGVGKSTWSARRDAYLIEHLLADIEAVINAVVGGSGQVHLVAHDWGSVIGWSFISDAKYASRVLSYTSMSGPHLRLMLDWMRRNLLTGEPRRMAKALRQAMLSWYVYLFNLPMLPEFVIKRFGRPIWRTALSINGIDKADDYLNASQPEVESLCLNSINLYRQNVRRPPELPAPNSINIPVQLLIADGDMFISDELFEFYGEYVADLQCHGIKGKHWAHHGHPQDFNRYVKQFVNQVEGRKRIN
ncbi:alpha/beta fold hydrolase [Marinobacter sp. SS21]|uniref:alpha/beta fold hydrolase n=1 Tax=Marinobacter sp. SS21 TaxID=2979460 RepID=UPI00232D8E07|nr:alpha/beta fold hydrolase [Marinobacter sp. SS21]MDC0661109.1 alpha/beta fold hydrolase [Marinobacter sp. SS21]